MEYNNKYGKKGKIWFSRIKFDYLVETFYNNPYFLKNIFKKYTRNKETT